MIMKKSEKRIVEMNGNMKMVTFAAAMVLLPLAVFSQQTNKWSNTAANTPDTAYDWMDGANWENCLPPVDGGYVNISPSKTLYVRLSESVSPQYFVGNANVRYLGNVSMKGANVGAKRERATFYSSGYHYGDIIFPSGQTKTPYLTNPKICGRLCNYDTSQSMAVTVPSGGFTFRFDLYARSGGELRTDDFSELKYLSVGNGTVNFFAPAGAEAVSGTWRLEKGSPFAYRVSAAHPLAVGTYVASGAALEDGTFLKHVFDDSTIELSAPALSSGEAELSFAAFNPDFTATFINPFVMQGTFLYLCAYRSRAEDAARISFVNGFNCTSTVSVDLNIGITEFDKIPATFVFGRILGGWKTGAMVLRNAHLEFEGDVLFEDKHPFTMPAGANGAYTARLTATNTQRVAISTLRDFAGTVVKDGSGMLTIGFDDAVNAGSLVVEGGVLTVLRNENAGSRMLSFKSVSVSAGAELVVPAEGIYTEELSLADTAVVSGGKITVLSARDSGTFVNDLGTGEVVGHPAFWLDATRSDTLEYTTENGTNYVTRWNDCRAGESMFCTNMVERPTFINGTAMSEKYVRIANCPNAKDYSETQMLVWNVPIRDIRAVFLVQDPTEGGGVILGRCSWRVSNDLTGCSSGGPYYRENYLYPTIPLVHRTYTTPAVTKGRFYLNGFEVAGTNTAYLGKFMQLVEHHVNTNLVGGTAKAVVCDAFGGCYDSPSATYIPFSNGGMRIAEYIIYTNSLTHAERVSVAQYLSRKWFGKNIYYTVTDETKKELSPMSASSVQLQVPPGKDVAYESLEGGRLTKTGNGRMYLKTLRGSDIEVKEGELLLSAWDRNLLVPPDSWLHVAADASDTIVTENDGVALSRWKALNLPGESLVNHRTVKAKIVKNGMNGRPLVDLGEKDKGAALKYEGVNSTGLTKTGFAVYDSAAGGGAFFGSVVNGFPSRGFPHDRTGGEYPPVVCDGSEHGTASWTGIPAMRTAAANGSAVFRRNGSVIDPFEVPFLFAPERFSFRYSTGRQILHFGAYGQCSQFNGGLKLGEMILFERELTDGEMADVEAYLAWRWFNISTLGYGAMANSVCIDTGAKLTVLGEGFSATALSGGGTIEGDIELADGGTLTAKITEAGTLETLTVQGTLALGGGSLVVEGDERNLPVGEYEIVSANEIVKGEGEWTLPQSKSRRYSLQFASDKIVLMVRKPGFYLICR